MKIAIKRVYDEPSEDDGIRLLVDRLWPRGITKARLRMDAWLKDIAPSTELRKSFGHDPSRFKEFEKAYFKELDAYKADWMPQIEKYHGKKITLLYAAKDPLINHAQCLRNYLQKTMK